MTLFCLFSSHKSIRFVLQCNNCVYCSIIIIIIIKKIVAWATTLHQFNSEKVLAVAVIRPYMPCVASWNP